MQIDIFCEMQRPRELWGDDAYEHTLIEETLEQAQLADELGYGCWWQVEHHGSVEFSYSSAPELMLATIAQRTQNLRLGHSAVLAPHRFNHPIRVAERAAPAALRRGDHGGGKPHVGRGPSQSLRTVV